MGVDITLVDKDEKPVKVPSFEAGGLRKATMLYGELEPIGTSEADVQVTYNYQPIYRKIIDNKEGLLWICGKTASETVERLELAVHALGTNETGDYYEATPGNAGSIASILLDWAKAYPNAKWRCAP
jgi:hypothetical protein